MELLQNYADKPDEQEYITNDHYFCEIKTHIDCIAELCQEGEISAYQAMGIIDGEIICSMNYQNYIQKKLNGLDKDSDEYIKNYAEKENAIFPLDEAVDLEEFHKQGMKNFYKKELEKIAVYIEFLEDTSEMIEEIFVTANYHKERKLKIKQQIIRDGVLSPTFETNDTDKQESDKQESENNLTDPFSFITVFPALKIDVPLLIKHGFLKKTDEGLRLGTEITKVFLSEYFMSIKPLKLKRMPWTNIEIIFDITGLKQSYNHREKDSQDYLRWVEIKKANTK